MKRLFPLFIYLLGYYPINVFSQDSTYSNINFGIRYNFFYNHNVMHHIPNFSIDIKQHNIYLGIQSTNILKPLGDPVDIYKKKSYGINFGYRYLLIDKQKKIVPFTQFNFSIYQVEYIEYQKGPPFSTEKQKLIVENTVSIGLNFNPINHIHIYSGIGFGSFDGFVLFFDSFTPNSYIGLEYKF